MRVSQSERERESSSPAPFKIKADKTWDTNYLENVGFLHHNQHSIVWNCVTLLCWLIQQGLSWQDITWPLRIAATDVHQTCPIEEQHWADEALVTLTIHCIVGSHCNMISFSLAVPTIIEFASLWPFHHPELMNETTQCLHVQKKFMLRVHGKMLNLRHWTNRTVCQC